MTLDELCQLLSAKFIVGGDRHENEFERVCGSDLMSDVLAYLNNQRALLLTGLSNNQVVRTAEMMDLTGIVFVRGKMPDQLTTDLARDKGIPLLVTPYSMFEACGKLYATNRFVCSIEN